MERLFSIIIVLAAVMTANAQEKYKTLKDIAYISADDTSAYRRERCKLDINMPVGKKGFKTIVWFHGGGLEGGNKEFRPELMNSGIAQVAPNYRLFPRCKCPDYTRDAAAAVAWTIKHIAEYGGDPTQVYVGGHSAGGYLTLMLALDKRYLAEYGVDADSFHHQAVTAGGPHMTVTATAADGVVEAIESSQRMCITGESSSSGRFL